MMHISTVRQITLICALVLHTVLASRVVHADTLTLKSGAQLRGDYVSADEDTVTFRIRGKDTTLPRQSIATVTDDAGNRLYPPPSENESSALPDKVSEALVREDFAEAERLLRQLLTAERDSVSALQALAAVFLLQDKWTNAEEMARTLIKLDSNDAQAHYLLGNALVGQRKFDEALISLRTALNLNPENAQYAEYADVIKRFAAFQAKTVPTESHVQEPLTEAASASWTAEFYRHAKAVAAFKDGVERNVRQRNQISDAQWAGLSRQVLQDVKALQGKIEAARSRGDGSGPAYVFLGAAVDYARQIHHAATFGRDPAPYREIYEETIADAMHAAE